MKAKDIVFKLMENMPKYTDKLSTYISPSSISFLGNTVTMVIPGHNLVNEQIVSIVGAQLANTISSISKGDFGDATVTCSTRTDFSGESKLLKISSELDPTINGAYAITGILSSNVIEISGFIYSGEIPADAVVVEEREISINGIREITVIDSNTVSFLNDYVINADLTIIADTVQVHNFIRISRAGSVKRLISNYNSEPPKQLTAWVVLGDNSISKDGNTYSDSDMEQGNQNEWEGILLTPFHIYVFQTLEKDIAAGAARDAMEDLRISLYKSILGQRFDCGTVAGVDSSVYPIGDSEYDNTAGYYVHDFEFGQSMMVSREDTNSDSISSQFQTISFDFIDENQLKLISGEVDLTEPEQE